MFFPCLPSLSILSSLLFMLSFFHYIKFLLIFLTLLLLIDFTSAVVIFVILVLFYLTGTFYAFQLHLQETMRMSPRSSKKRTNVSTHLLATTLKHVERDKQAFIKTFHKTMQGGCRLYENLQRMSCCSGSECSIVAAQLDSLVHKFSQHQRLKLHKKVALNVGLGQVWMHVAGNVWHYSVPS